MQERSHDESCAGCVPLIGSTLSLACVRFAITRFTAVITHVLIVVVVALLRNLGEVDADVDAQDAASRDDAAVLLARGEDVRAEVDQLRLHQLAATMLEASEKRRGDDMSVRGAQVSSHATRDFITPIVSESDLFTDGL